MFFMPVDGFYSSPSASMMAQVTQTDKPIEEQLEDIKALASQITFAIQSEMANLLSYALASDVDAHEQNHNNLRKRRSVETPMDSSQLVMRLLKHIKSNNEYQNIAIEKMMSAQEIAEKYGIAFNPDPEILSDLAIAANEQAQEMTAILNDALRHANVTKENITFVPLEETQQTPVNSTTNGTEHFKQNETYYVYSIHVPEEIIAQQNTPPHHEHQPDIISNGPQNHHHHHEHHQNFHYYPETQIFPPPHQHYTPMPNFFEPLSFFPTQDYYSQYAAMEPITTTTTIVLPFEELYEPEPLLVGEEYEETVTSKTYIDHEGPDAGTVNHVMTYTLSEKSHFKTPQIEKLPQQMQYYFFLI